MPFPSSRSGRACDECQRPADAKSSLCLNCASIERHIVPARPERRQLAPACFVSSPAWLATDQQSNDETLWTHQSLALDRLAAGENVVTATGTASGKSLIFQLAALRVIHQDPNARVIVFYPLKALSHDQLRRWREAATLTGIPAGLVQNLDGDVPQRQRSGVLHAARILVATPDICHAWLLRRSADAENREFLENLALVILDESHTYESVFGSNGAYLMRRLTAAVAENGRHPPQYCAATATAHAPTAHLAALTGLSFTAVTEVDNGSPRHERTVLQVPAEEIYQDRILQAADMLDAILTQHPEAQALAFVDSRQGVERIVNACDRQDVHPYRGGYRSEERREIETGMREGSIRGIVSTSALELGIDLPDLNYGINLGLPVSRKRLHQRLGRIGRRKPGTFIIIEDRYTLALHGASLREYCEQEVEPSRLYLENAYVQQQQALCLRRELRDRRVSITRLPPVTQWPAGFDDVVAGVAHRSAHNGLQPHSEPHLKYSLRSTKEANDLELIATDAVTNAKASIGNIQMEQAIREAYPGAIYRHRGKAYTARGWWRPKTGKPYIELERALSDAQDTRPLTRNAATVSLRDAGIMDGNYRHMPEGIIAEVKCYVDHSVEGYQTSSGVAINYDNAEGAHLTRKHYEYDTTGVMLRISQQWFQGPYEAETRKAIAQAMKQHLCYRTATPAGDIDFIWQNVALDHGPAVEALEDAILVFDAIPGSLRLTTDLYRSMHHYAEIISSSVIAEDSREASWVRPSTAASLQAWLQGQQSLELSAGNAEIRFLRVFRPSSTVTTVRGDRQEIESYTVQPGPAGIPVVTYDCRAPDGGTHQLGERQLTRQGQTWNWEIYDCRNGSTQELPNL